MNLQDELHRLIDALNGGTAKQQLHAVVDELNEEQASVALTRMRGMRNFFEKLGIYF